jgi:hypothetical protein
MAASRAVQHPWTREELLLVFNLYCRTPFGRLHKTNPDVVALAEQLKTHNANAVAMKLSNFASFDPLLQARGIRGLPNAGAGERKLWEEFHADPERVAFESEEARKRLVPEQTTPEKESWIPPLTPGGPTERDAVRRVRLVQQFFRDAVLIAYGNECAVCRIPEERLLTASHIIRWADEPRRRADPTNGLSLCTLHDRAFDRGLIGVDDHRRVLLSSRLRRQTNSAVFEQAFARLEGAELKLPDRFAPDAAALAIHRESVFLR